MTKYRCPQCHQPSVYEGNPYRPFCSERCKMIDLGAWATGEYRIPASPDSSEEEEILENLSETTLPDSQIKD